MNSIYSCISYPQSQLIYLKWSHGLLWYLINTKSKIHFICCFHLDFIRNMAYDTIICCVSFSLHSRNIATNLSFVAILLLSRSANKWVNSDWCVVTKLSCIEILSNTNLYNFMWATREMLLEGIDVKFLCAEKISRTTISQNNVKIELNKRFDYFFLINHYCFGSVPTRMFLLINCS